MRVHEASEPGLKLAPGKGLVRPELGGATLLAAISRKERKWARRALEALGENPADELHAARILVKRKARP